MSLARRKAPLPLSAGEGGPIRRMGGEGLADSAVQTLTSQASLGPLLSRGKRERGFSVDPADA
jgi:hypothetical protein